MRFLTWLKHLIFGRPAHPGLSPFPPGQGPARLLVLRHAEKTGDKRDKHLSGPGWERAEKLAAYIPQKFGRPDFLIAASNSEKSKRPVETLEPLAKALGLPIEAQYDDEAVDELIANLGSVPRYAGKFGVISWRHSDLSRLITELGAPQGTFPVAWDPLVYDLIVEIVFDGPKVTAREIKQPF